MRYPVLLAETYAPGSMDPTGWWLSEKYDGLRCIWDHESRTFYSRNGNPFAAPSFFTEKLPKLPLDGELWLGRGMFDEASSIVRSSQDKGWKDLHFMLIDIPWANAGPFEERYAILQHLMTLGVGAHVHLITQTQCTGAPMLEKTLEFIVQNGGEGLMLRKPRSVYVGSRSPTLLKYKRRLDAEAVVVAYEPGEGGCAGLMGALWCALPNGVKFKVGTGFDLKDRRNPPPIGSTITFSYLKLTKTGKPYGASFERIRKPE